jgi:hypothetical protein
MKMALKLIMVLAVASGGCQSAMAQWVATFSSYHAEKRYDFNLSFEQLEKTPYWTAKAPNPPLSVRQAKLIGMASLRKIFSDAEKWELGGINLVPLRDRWVYLIAFHEPPPPGCYDCLSSPFNVLVTMDGAAVVPKVSVWKPYGSDSGGAGKE